MNRLLPSLACALAAFIAVCDGAEHTLRFEDGAAGKVEVAGEFNDWKAAPMERDADGVWTITLDVPDGVYAYKFLVDGRWTFDPANSERKTSSGIENSALTVGDGNPPAEAAVAKPAPDRKPVSFAGQLLDPGRSNIVEIEVTDRQGLKVIEKAYGKPSKKAKVLLLLPENFDPAKSYPLVIESATTDGSGSSIDGAQPYIGSILKKGAVLLAVDGEHGKPSGGKDATTFRWALVEAALQQMNKDWPASKTWPVSTAGISGGAGYASYNAIMLVDKRYPVAGMFLANSGWTPLDFMAELKRVPSTAMHKVPVFMTAGDSDTIATRDITEKARTRVQRERFKNVRYETFPGGHELSPPLFEAALDWFAEQKGVK